MFLKDRILHEQMQKSILLKMFPSISFMLEQTCILEASIIAELTVLQLNEKTIEFCSLYLCLSNDNVTLESFPFLALFY